MRQTEIENKLKELEIRIEHLENMGIVTQDFLTSSKDGKIVNNQEKQKKESIPRESGITTVKFIPDKLPQENNEQSVDEKERIAYNKRPKPTDEGASTAESDDGESPVDILNVTKEQILNAIISKGMAEAEIVKDIKKGKTK